MGAERDASFGRWRAIATAVIVGALVSPALRDHDSFPLSTYPVYASARGSTVTLSTAIGVDTGGVSRRLSLAIIASTDDPLIAESLVDDAIASGRAAELCAEIASRAPDDVVAVEVVAERHDVDARAGGSESLQERTRHARCEVRR